MKLKRVTGNMKSRLDVFPRKEDLEHQQCEVKIEILWTTLGIVSFKNQAMALGDILLLEAGKDSSVNSNVSIFL